MSPFIFALEDLAWGLINLGIRESLKQLLSKGFEIELRHDRSEYLRDKVLNDRLERCHRHEEAHFVKGVFDMKPANRHPLHVWKRLRVVEAPSQCLDERTLV